MIETWKKIDGYQYYEVSTEGRVRSLDRPKPPTKHAIPREGRVLRPGLDSSGYPSVSLREAGKIRTRNVHRLVAETFLPREEGKPEINHKDTNKKNNRLENLEWCTHQFNSAHAGKHGLMTKLGEKNPASKMTEEKVKYVRELYKDLYVPEIARELGVSTSCIHSIVTGKNWRA